MTSKEKLPDIYSTKLASDQSIKQRNEVIDEYIKSLENNKEELFNAFNYFQQLLKKEEYKCNRRE